MIICHSRIKNIYDHSLVERSLYSDSLKSQSFDHKSHSQCEKKGASFVNSHFELKMKNTFSAKVDLTYKYLPLSHSPTRSDCSFYI